MKKHYSVLIMGDGFSDYPETKIDVFCAKRQLETIARALTAYQYKIERSNCCCLAKEGGGVSRRNYDFCFADCM